MGGMTRPTPSALIRFALMAGDADSDTTGLVCADKAGNSIAVGDEIIGAVELVTVDNTPTDRTAVSAVIAGGRVTVPASASDVVAVWWMAKTDEGNEQVASPKVMANLGTGAGISTNVAITGIAVGDALICVVEIAATTGAWTDRTDTCSITSDGNIQCTADTTGDSLYVMWMSKTNEVSNANYCMKFALGTAGTSAGSDVNIVGIEVDDDIISCLLVDETTALPEEDVATITSTPVDGFIEIGATSPTLVAGYDLFVFWNSRKAGNPE